MAHNMVHSCIFYHHGSTWSAVTGSEVIPLCVPCSYEIKFRRFFCCNVCKTCHSITCSALLNIYTNHQRHHQTQVDYCKDWVDSKDCTENKLIHVAVSFPLLRQQCLLCLPHHSQYAEGCLIIQPNWLEHVSFWTQFSINLKYISLQSGLHTEMRKLCIIASFWEVGPTVIVYICCCQCA